MLTGSGGLVASGLNSPRAVIHAANSGFNSAPPGVPPTRELAVQSAPVVGLPATGSISTSEVPSVSGEVGHGGRSEYSNEMTVLPSASSRVMSAPELLRFPLIHSPQMIESRLFP